MPHINGTKPNQTQNETDPGPGDHIQISFPDASLADNETFARQLTNFINSVYIGGEAEFWKGGKLERCQPPEVRDLIRSAELAIAWRKGSPQTEGRDVVGCIKMQMVDEKTSTFGLLTSDPAYRGKGIGRELVRFAETWAKQQGAVVMQMELLYADGWHHPLKTRLGEWYERAGYEFVRSMSFAEMFPELSKLLDKPCNLRVYQKPLL